VNGLFDLTGRTALVTGARTGIGRAIAIGLGAAGAHVIVHGRTDDLDEVAARIPSSDRWVYDLADPGGLPAAVATLPPVDILVNNAGIIHREPAVAHSYEGWRAVLTVNVDAVFRLTQLIGAGMVERRSGKIITIASLLSFQGGINVPSYATAKHAVAGLTKALANEWAASNVQVNAVAPGYIATDNTTALRADAQRLAAITDRIPAGRWGDPADLVGAAVFLAARASDYVNGHLLAVDGGWLAR
jgi:2-dehydro-3-deoxy-D-gluconate 5-dehydrogenase